MNNAILMLRAQTAVHLGAGAAIGAIDLPIQRERHTHWPMGQSSGVKGVLRDLFRKMLVASNAEVSLSAADESPEVKRLFGPSQIAAGDDGQAGSFGVTDARIAAFPVRASNGSYALLVCADLLNRVAEDLALAGLTAALWGNRVSDIPNDQARKVIPQGQNVLNTSLVLEDIAVTVIADGGPLGHYATWLRRAGCRTEKLILVSNEIFTHCVRYNTEIITRIKLDYSTKTVVDGALFTQELLPAETALYALLLSESDLGTLPQKVNERKVLQLGGDETIGKGWCWAKVEGN